MGLAHSIRVVGFLLNMFNILVHVVNVILLIEGVYLLIVFSSRICKRFLL